MNLSSINRKQLFSNVHFWLPLCGIAAFFLLVLQLRFINTGSFLGDFSFSLLMKEGWLIIIQMITVLYFVYYATRFFDQKFPSKNLSIRRYTYELAVVVLIGFLINKFFHLLFIKLVVLPEDDITSLNRKLRNLLLVTQSLIVIFYGLLTAFRIYRSFREKQQKVLQWQKEYSLTQFETLKNQLNPHFLFNSLSVLTSLVYADAEKAELFIDKLSKTYRYLLDQREKEAVLVAEELNFLNNYSFLVDQRYGDKIRIVQRDIKMNEQLFILPHTFLVVLEYITGTNMMSASRPLEIVILIKQQTLLFQFNHQEKAITGNHLQMQFSSLQQRYIEMGKKMTVFNNDPLKRTIAIQLISRHD